MATERIELISDVECFKTYFLIRFLREDTGVMMSFAQYAGHPLDKLMVERIMRTYTIVGFNFNNYDKMMIALALAGRSNEELKQASDIIIGARMQPWIAEKHFGFRLPKNWDIIDLIEPAPAVLISLKLYEGRMHAKTIQDMPYEHTHDLQPHEFPVVEHYCGVDLAGTSLLKTFLAEPLALRKAMSEEYGIDLRSKSDAQFAEAILKKRISEILAANHALANPPVDEGYTRLYSGESYPNGAWLGDPYDKPNDGWGDVFYSAPSAKEFKLERPDIPTGTSFRYKAPSFIQFATPELRQLLVEMQEVEFVIGNSGAPEMPKGLEGRKITVGDMIYKVGMGGLHSTEKSTTHRAIGCKLIDCDVVSFYPWIMLLCELYPEHIGPAFLIPYREFVEGRVTAKELMQAFEKAMQKGSPLWVKAKNEADGKKIGANGTFGKLGSPYSVFYSPDSLIQVTVTGQLLLLMMIEAVHLLGLRVVSANTDGFVTVVPFDREEEYKKAIVDWEGFTKFKTEKTEYKLLASRDVNNYVAVKAKGGTKGKGIFANPWAEGDLRGQLMKSPEMTICTEAVHAYLENGTSIHQTIFNCTDIRKFVQVRTVNGGAFFHDEKLGRVARWYRSTGSTEPIRYAKKFIEEKVKYIKKKGVVVGEEIVPAHWQDVGNMVPKSENAKPVMVLPDELPRDIDYDFYIREAIDMVKETGAI